MPISSDLLGRLGNENVMELRMGTWLAAKPALVNKLEWYGSAFSEYQSCYLGGQKA
jgi:hypothetical protein